MRNRRAFWLIAVAVVTVINAGACAESGPPVGPEKKLLAWGVNAVDSAYLQDHVGDLEKEYAVDGIVLGFVPDDWRARGQRGFQTRALFGGRRFSPEDFSETIAHLKQTKFSRFTDNFLYVTTSVFGSADPAEGNLDWFDERWPVIAQNMALYATIARDAGFKGLMLDFENYKNSLPLWRCFEYSTFEAYRKDRGMERIGAEKYHAQLRKRGRQMMAAVSEAYPDITFLMIPWCSEDAAAGGYDMLPAFVDGLLEGAGPNVTLVNALERGYPLQSHKEFMHFRDRAERKGPRNSKTPKLYAERMRYGFGFWIDYDPNTYGGWHTAPGNLERNHRSPKGLEHGLYNALTVSDGYVWLYVWHPEYFWNPETRLPENHHRQQQRQCVLCTHSVMPKPYLDAIVNCRRPHDLEWAPILARPIAKVYTNQEVAAMGESILANGGFEDWPAGDDQPPDHWVRGGIVSIKKSSGARFGKICLGLTNNDQGHGFLDQRIPAAPYAGKTIIFGAWCKASRASPGLLSILDWVGTDHDITHNTAGESAYDQWHFLAARRTIRKDATGELWFRLNCHPDEAGATVYYDGAVVVVEEATDDSK